MKAFHLARQWVLLESVYSSERKTWGWNFERTYFLLSEHAEPAHLVEVWWWISHCLSISPSNTYSPSHALHSASSFESHILGKWLRVSPESKRLAGEMPRGPGIFLVVLLHDISWWTGSWVSCWTASGVSALTPPAHRWSQNKGHGGGDEDGSEGVGWASGLPSSCWCVHDWKVHFLLFLKSSVEFNFSFILSWRRAWLWKRL